RPQSITPRRLDDLTIPELEDVASRIDRSADDPEAMTIEVLRQLHAGELSEGVTPLDLMKTHPDVETVVDTARRATAYPDLVAAVFREPDDEGVHALRLRVVEGLVAALSHVRATEGRRALGVELSFWVRELTRIQRVASAVPAYHWGDDGSWVGAQDD